MIKANSQYSRKNKRTSHRETPLKAFRDMGLFHQERFHPQDGLNEPELKEGFSLPWISDEGLRLNDRLILELFHYVEMALIVLIIGFVFFVHNKLDWSPILLTTLIFVIGAGMYRNSLFRKLNKNLRAVIRKAKGKFMPGNSVLAVPPQARFDYKNQDCHVMSLIDQNFRLVLEYSCYLGKEFEFRIEESHKGDPHWIIFGQDKDAVRKILDDQRISEDLHEIFRNFNYLSYGKDGMMHVGESFDGKLTAPKIVFDTLDRMISFGKLLKLNEEG